MFTPRGDTPPVYGTTEVAEAEDIVPLLVVVELGELIKAEDVMEAYADVADAVLSEEETTEDD